jgi:hypothetical protein
MNFHIAKVATTFMTSVIQLFKYVTSFTYSQKKAGTPARNIKHANYVNMSGNCVKISGIKGLKFMPL